MKKIALSGKVGSGLFVIVDDADYARFGAMKWHAVKPPTSGPYAARVINGKHVYLHRAIVGFPKSKVDHKNGDTLDCRRDNLRGATTAQNNWNRKSLSGHKNVAWCSRTSRWIVTIKVNGKSLYFGRFGVLTEAVKVAKHFRTIHHGEFANG